MPTAEELIVAVKSEGVSETRSELNGVSQEMQETADQAGSSAENLEGFANRFEGAIAAATAALAIAAVGFASQVPVVGEAFSGLGAIVQAVAFQMDKVLRPILSPLGKALFGVSEFIFEAEGALGAFFGVVATGVTVIGGLLAAVGTAAGAFLAFGGSMSTLVTIGATVLGAIGLIVTAIASLPATVVAAIAAVLAFATALIFNIGGARDAVVDILGKIANFVMDSINFFAENGLSAISKFVKNVISFFSSLGSNIFEVLDNIASNAFEAGKNIVTNLIDGMKNILSGDSEIGEMLGLDSIETPSTDELSFDGVDTDNLGVSKNKFKFDSESFESDISGRSISQEQFMSNNSFTLDGRKMTEDTGRYRSDASLRRGI